MFVTVNDLVDVIAAFVGDKVSPIRFRWEGRIQERGAGPWRPQERDTSKRSSQ